MILVDTNVWVALLIDNHEFHDDAEGWLAGLDEPGGTLVCRATQQSILRLLTTNTVFTPYGSSARSNAQAWSAYHDLLGDERIAFVEEPPGLEAHWERLANRRSPSPKLWMDAYLAAFAIAGGYQFVTTDRAFRQHEGLDLILLAEH